MSGNNGRGPAEQERVRSSAARPLALLHTGLAEPYRMGAAGVEEAAVPAAHRVRAPQARLPGIRARRPALALELKAALGRHLYEDAEAAAVLRERILDLRQNPSVLAREPDQRLSLLLDELLHARTDEELLVGLYEIVKPALLEAEREYARTTQQIVDYPTVRLLRPIIADLEEQIAGVSAPCASWSMSAVGAARSPSLQNDARLSGCGRRHQRSGAGGGSASAGRRWRSHAAISLPLQAIRDERMPAETSSFASARLRIRANRRRRAPPPGAHDAHAAGGDGRRRGRRRRHLGEAGPAVGVHLDLARHEWDEMRHALMGQAALEAEGIDWMRYPQFTGDYDLNATNVPSAQYAWLLGIEQNAMRRTGKRGEFEFCRDEANHPLMTQFQDFDWADEVKHVHIGREWTTHLYDGDASRAKAAAEQAVEEFCRASIRRP